MTYLAILLIVSCLTSLHLINSAEDKMKSAIVYGTKEDVINAEKKLDVLSNRCLWINVLLFLLMLYTMIK